MKSHSLSSLSGEMKIWSLSIRIWRPLLRSTFLSRGLWTWETLKIEFHSRDKVGLKISAHGSHSSRSQYSKMNQRIPIPQLEAISLIPNLDRCQRFFHLHRRGAKKKTSEGQKRRWSRLCSRVFKEDKEGKPFDNIQNSPVQAHTSSLVYFSGSKYSVV